MNALIFGSNGQDGRFLTDLLKKQNVEVKAISRTIGDIVGSVSDYKLVESSIKLFKPNYIFHFAANSTTKHDALFDNHKSISTGTINILEAVRLHCPTSRIFLCGSAMQFKNDGLPINEETPFRGSSPYSVARIHSVYAGRYYHKTFDLFFYVGYFFNHDSHLRTERHVNMKIIAAAKRISKGSTEKLELGNIDVQKEFNYAGDVVEAVWKLVNQDTIFETIIGSGKTFSIKNWLEICFKKIDKSWEEHVVIKHGYIPEYKILISNPKLINSLGWKPKVDIYQLADLMFENTCNKLTNL